MSEKAFDYKKEYKDLYLPKGKPVLVDIPSMNFIMVNGIGDPNNNLYFEQAVELLYGLSFTIKMSKMKGNQPEGYFEYVVPPLEGLWWVDETIGKIDAFIKQEGLNCRLGSGGKHHEIYLSDPRKSKPESLKTVLRHPVKYHCARCFDEV